MATKNPRKRHARWEEIRPADLKRMKMCELLQAAEDAGVDDSGSKQELVDRLTRMRERSLADSSSGNTTDMSTSSGAISE